ncbi:MAG: SprT family zinc-dependent metalloprotease [Elusimicrobiota bacterium]
MRKEKEVVRFGTRKINFFVQRSKRWTVSLFVDPKEGVYLRAPFGLSLDSLSKLVYQKGIWILKKQRQIAELSESIPIKEFVSGESYLYLGRQLRLKILTSKKTSKPGVTAKEGRFIVRLNARYSGAGKKRVIRNALIQWYKNKAANILGNRIRCYAPKLNVSCSKLILANQSKRWGSCSHDGNIRLNWHILMAPVVLGDYIVAHELCHLRFKNHSQSFWKLLGNIMPDYEVRRKRLCIEGTRYYF